MGKQACQSEAERYEQPNRRAEEQTRDFERKAHGVTSGETGEEDAGKHCGFGISDLIWDLRIYESTTVHAATDNSVLH